MPESPYQPDECQTPVDAMIVLSAGPEPRFDAIARDFLFESHRDLKRRCQCGGLLRFASLGRTCPWLYRFTFDTRGLAMLDEGEVISIRQHVVALRIPPDYLRHANRFTMLRLVEPRRIFHPNIAVGGGICAEIYPGEPIVEICQSLHDLFRWRLRQYDERDALNPAACAWGRLNIDKPIDDRPLFGQRLSLQWTAEVDGGAKP